MWDTRPRLSGGRVKTDVMSVSREGRTQSLSSPEGSGACWPKGSCSHRRRNVQAIVKSSMVEKTAGKKDIWYSNGMVRSRNRLTVNTKQRTPETTVETL